MKQNIKDSTEKKVVEFILSLTTFYKTSWGQLKSKLVLNQTLWVGFLISIHWIPMNIYNWLKFPSLAAALRQESSWIDKKVESQDEFWENLKKKTQGNLQRVMSKMFLLPSVCFISIPLHKTYYNVTLQVKKIETMKRLTNLRDFSND